MDEIKREELERLRHLATKQNELTNGIDTEHLDLKNTHTFEIQDLKKLIAKVIANCHGIQLVKLVLLYIVTK